LLAWVVWGCEKGFAWVSWLLINIAKVVLEKLIYENKAALQNTTFLQKWSKVTEIFSNHFLQPNTWQNSVFRVVELFGSTLKRKRKVCYSNSNIFLKLIDHRSHVKLMKTFKRDLTKWQNYKMMFSLFSK